MGPAAEPAGLSVTMIAAAVLLFALIALGGFFFLKSRFRPPARQVEGPVEPGVPESRAP